MENKKTVAVLIFVILTLFATLSSFLIDFKGILEGKYMKVLGEEVEVDLDATIGGNITPTPTSSAGPTATPKNCGAYCWNDTDCGGSLHCYYGFCRHPNCLTETDCDCIVQTPTPTPTAAPTGEEETPYPFPTPEVEAGKFIIYGYGPSFAKVVMTGLGVSERTVANATGYYEFRRLAFPTILAQLVGNWYPELCFSAVDDASRQTNPVCIAPLPLSSNSKSIGPILLPPTLSVSKGNLLKNEQAQASGKTTPNSSVEIYLASAKTSTDIFTIVKNALAYYVPTYQITSNSEGNYEFNLPNDKPNTWRVFAASKVLGASSPKSNTLTFNILSSYSTLITFLIYILGLLRPYLIYIVILIQLLIVVFLVRSLAKKKSKKGGKSKSTQK